MAFRVRVSPAYTKAVALAFETIKKSDDPEEVEQAIADIKEMDWAIEIYHKEFVEPPRPIAGEETLFDLHCMVRCLLRDKGAKSVFALYEAWGIDRLAQLPCCHYPQFAADCTTLFYGIRTLSNGANEKAKG